MRRSFISCIDKCNRDRYIRGHYHCEISSPHDYKLQPLDVTCFSPLKRKWETLLAERGNVLDPRETLSKSTFVDLICSIWHQGLSAENAISGFRVTGIYPTDKTRYPTNRFDPHFLNVMNTGFKWVNQKI